MRILYVPLDERPCNYRYPQMIATLAPEIELVVPDLALLGRKKTPAEIEPLWTWVWDTAPRCQVAILSVEMLVYGGLLPSRLHHDSDAVLRSRLQSFATLKQQNPQLLIFASNLIMRTPHYDSSEEEPDYYADFGQQIFRWGWLSDRKNRQGLIPEETHELGQLKASIPESVLQDYRDRRQKNIAVNLAAIDFVRDGMIDFLSIPQDDSAPYGFTALDQQQVIQRIIHHRLQQTIHLYPGADEVGCTLLARAYLHLTQKSCTFYPLLSSVCGEQIIPLYEDRPLGESLKAHVLAAGAQIMSTPDQADVILAINTAGKVMQESWDQPTKDVTYSSYRNLRFFVAQIKQFCDQGKRVAIADVAFANGGETELIQLLDDVAAWDEVLAYAGWNTNCNTLGTVLATAILGHASMNREAIAFNKLHHLLEDWAYQAITRMEIVKNYLPTIDASYYDFNGQDQQVHQAIKERLIVLRNEMLVHSFQNWEITQLNVSTPWNRMFEIGLDLEITPRHLGPNPTS